MYKLDKDEYIVYSQKKSWWTKIICSLFTVGSISFGLRLLFDQTPDLDLKMGYYFVTFSIFLPTAYFGFQWLICKAILTNKRVLSKNLFFITRSVYLDKIIYVAILNNPYFLSGLGDLCIKTKGKFLPTRVRVPDEHKFKDKILEYVSNSTPDNILNQGLLEKTLFYKFGVYQ